MINQSLADEIFRFFQRYLTFYKEFLQLETEKYNDIAVNRVSALDGHVKAEEALMLKSRGLELERDRLVAKTEKPEATFRELIPLFEHPLQEQVKQIYDELSKVLLDLKEINLRCNYLTELRLHRIQIDLKKLENHPELQKLYNAQARAGGASMNFISKKI